MNEVLAAGQLRKMHTSLQAPVDYQLPLGDTLVPMNSLIGESLALDFLGLINCIHCGRKTKKSFNQGYCYPCFSRLAQCDSCIVSPEKCHYHEGTCREPEWGDEHCMIDHIVYLANSSGVKVGITRGSQVPTRWMDQGAIQALPVFRVSTRRLSGLVEVAYKQHIADKTNWRAMLKGQVDPLDLAAERDRLFELCANEIAALQGEHGLQAIQLIESGEAVEISYPVEEYPVKIVSFNLDKQALVQGRLMGIKGQYLIFDAGVINMRKYGGYHLQLSRN
ncbi:MAG: DUF2797 domain-containing protein [Gammaproteobacteria bacterium]|nr:DUF2797 domain-containing protein [Gammaproteobacteria bacterium]